MSEQTKTAILKGLLAGVLGMIARLTSDMSDGESLIVTTLFLILLYMPHYK